MPAAAVRQGQERYKIILANAVIMIGAAGTITAVYIRIIIAIQRAKAAAAQVMWITPAQARKHAPAA